MDPEEDDFIPDDFVADEPTGGPRRARRIVMGEGGSEEGARVETGRLFDDSEPLPDAPPDRIKGAPSGHTAQQAEWWRRREEDRDLAQSSLGGDTARTILGLIPGVRSVDPQVAEAPARMTRRARRMGEEWVDTTAGGLRGAFSDVEQIAPDAGEHSPALDVVAAPFSRDAMRRTAARGAGALADMVPADIGNRPPDQSAGLDRRAEAFPAGMAEAVTLGNADEAAGMLTSDANPESYRTARDRAQARRLDAQQQSPSLYAGGEAAGTAALMALPTPAGGAGRVAMGAGLGALAGSGYSEADAGTADHARDTALGALVGGGSAGLAEGAAQVLNPRATGGMASRLERSADRSQRVADQARLEASGVWGGRAMRAADELPGGQERLAADLRRLQIGQRGDFSIPRMQRAAEDAETLRRASGSSLGSLVDTADASGARVSTAGVQSRVEQLAQELDRLPVGGRQAAQQLREIAGDLATAGDLSPRDAWAQRQLLDDMIGGYQRDPNMAALSGRLSAVRRALSDELGGAMASAGLGPQWAHGSRDYQLGAFMRDHGRGADRLSVGGGMGGAAGAGQLAAQAVTQGPGAIALSVPQQMLERHIAQETRMAFPGVRARAGEASAGAQRSAAGFARSLSSTSRGPEATAARRILGLVGRGGATQARGASEPSGDLVTRMLRESPEALGEYAQHFEAAQGDPQEIARIHYTLSQQDPEYRATIERARQER
jgi:hypothetical protein